MPKFQLNNLAYKRIYYTTSNEKEQTTDTHNMDQSVKRQVLCCSIPLTWILEKMYLINSIKKQICGCLGLVVEKLIGKRGIRELLRETEMFSILIEMKDTWWGYKFVKTQWRASLVAQWLRICMPVQGTRVRALVWEDPTCRGETRPVSHNYWACVSGACAPQQERPQ